MKKYCLTMLLLTLSGALLAQDATGQGVEMADPMRSNGKIFVVVAVVLTIFAGLALYLWRLDRKIDRLEKESTR